MTIRVVPFDAFSSRERGGMYVLWVEPARDATVFHANNNS